MLERWGWFVVRRCRLILAVALLGTLAAGWFGLQISDRLSHQIFPSRDLRRSGARRSSNSTSGSASPISR